MGKNESKSDDFYDKHSAEEIGARGKNGERNVAIKREVEAILEKLPTQILESIACYNKRFKECVGEIQTNEPGECLCLLKALSGIEDKPRRGVLSKIYLRSSSILMLMQKEKRAKISICGPEVCTLDFSGDAAIVNNPNPILKILHKHCPNVDTVILNSCNVDSEGIRNLARVRGLRSLSLSFCDHLSEKHIRELGKITQLKELKLSWNPKLPLDALSSLSDLKELELLDVSRTNTSDEELKSIARLKNLTTLNLEDCKSIFDEGLPNLKPLKKLHTINLSSGSITDEGIKKMVELFPNLVSVTVKNNYLSDSGASELAKLDELTHLDLSWSHNLGGSFLNSLAALPKLRILNLARSNRLEISKIPWKQFKNLMYLNLSFTNIDDEAIRQISFMPMFCGGSFANSNNLTLKGVKSLAGVNNIHYLDFTNCGLSFDEVSPHFPPDVDIRV